MVTHVDLLRVAPTLFVLSTTTVPSVLVDPALREIHSLSALHVLWFPIVRFILIYIPNHIKHFVNHNTAELSANIDPCQPTPCGPNSKCRNSNGHPACSCLTKFIGAPPNCRPECTINQDCQRSDACINQKCMDPCPGSCGLNSQCLVQNHIPICTCFENYIGNPFVVCNPTPPPCKK